MQKVRRILIVKLSSIGDVVHALPVSAALGDAFPHVEITWIVESMSAPIVRCNPYLADVIEVPGALRDRRFSPGSVGSFLSMARELRRRRFDIAIDLQGLSKSAAMTFASGARYRFGYDWLREIAPLLVKRIPRNASSEHIVDQFLDVARFLGAPGNEVKFPLAIPPDEDAGAREVLSGVGIDSHRPFLVVNPSAGGGGHKGWGAERYADLLDRIAGQSPPAVLVGSGGDREVADAILGRAKSEPASLVGQTSLLQLAAILRAAALHICGDTGSAHIAAAVGTRVVSIFGRSNPDRLAPYGQADLVVHRRDQCCTICRRFHESAPLNSRQKCLAPPPQCMSAITVQMVADAVEKGLASRATNFA
jgi:heptosyltransferase-1